MLCMFHAHFRQSSHSTRMRATHLCHPTPKVISRLWREAAWIHCGWVGAGGALPEPLYRIASPPRYYEYWPSWAPTGPFLQRIALSWREPPGLRSRVPTTRDDPQQWWIGVSQPPGLGVGTTPQWSLHSRVPCGSGQGWVSWDYILACPFPLLPCPTASLQVSPNSSPFIKPNKTINQGTQIPVSGSAS